MGASTVRHFSLLNPSPADEVALLRGPLPEQYVRCKRCKSVQTHYQASSTRKAGRLYWYCCLCGMSRGPVEQPKKKPAPKRQNYFTK